MIRNWFTNGIKWAAGFVLVPALMAMIGGGGIWLHQYITYDRHLSQTQGSAKFKRTESEYCTQPDYLISVIFINNSTKTIEHTEFYPEARYKRRSRNLAYNNRRIDDSITDSKEFSGLCWGIPKLDTTEDPASLVWAVRIVDVDFKKENGDGWMA